MRRRLMRGALALTPIALVADYGFHAGSSADFVLAALALAPLAFVIGEATENVAHHTGDRVGALLNASFGNAPELIIALFAVRDGLPAVMRGSIAGSVASTSLLVCGGAMLAGGDGRLDRRSLVPQLATLLVAVALFLVPAVGGFSGNPERHALYTRTVPVAAVLLVAYLALLATNLRAVRPTVAPPLEAWSLRSALAVLAAATAATAVVSEVLVGSLQAFGHALGLSQLFVAAVIVALAGNAAEQGGAVIVARRGNPGLGAEIAVSSATQIAVLVCPVAALASAIGGHDLPLSFDPVELGAMGGGGLAVLAHALRGRSSKAGGALLLACYAGAVAAFALSSGG